VIQDVGADPIRRVSHEAEAPVWVELSQGVHQAEVAFGDELAQRHSVALVLDGRGYHVAHVRPHEAIGGPLVVLVAVSDGQLRLFFPTQRLVLADLIHVLGNGYVCVLCCGHRRYSWNLPVWGSIGSTRARWRRSRPGCGFFRTGSRKGL